MKGGDKVKESCVTIDVSKGHSHFQGYLDKDNIATKASKFIHTKEGFNTVKLLADQMREKGNEVVYVFEATGVYHRGLKQYLEEHNEQYIILNPLEAAKVRKSKLRAVKTDKRDCASIAKAYYMNEYQLNKQQDRKAEDLQRYHRYYVAIIEELRKIKNRYRAQLDIVYPLFDKLYSRPYQEIPMAIIKKYPHPKLLQKTKPSSLVKYLNKTTIHRISKCERETKILLDYSKNIQSGCDPLSADTKILKQLQNILVSKLKEVDECLTHMKMITSEQGLYHQLLSIPGIGEVLATRLLAELGDLSRFENHRQIVAYAGIDPTVYQSGSMSGKHFSITKKGNRHLRTLLYLAVTMNLRSRMSNSIRDFYTKKRQQANPLAHNTAVIASANKLVRIIFAMYRSREYFQF